MEQAIGDVEARKNVSISLIHDRQRRTNYHHYTAELKYQSVLFFQRNTRKNRLKTQAMFSVWLRLCYDLRCVLGYTR